MRNCQEDKTSVSKTSWMTILSRTYKVDDTVFGTPNINLVIRFFEADCV